MRSGAVRCIVMRQSVGRRLRQSAPRLGAARPVIGRRGGSRVARRPRIKCPRRRATLARQASFDDRLVGRDVVVLAQ